MSMRITTKMMQSKSLYNINTNKTLQEKLTTQMSTMKKITRPSDDPVIAIRSLKLNSSLNKIDQYYEKNAKDARSWLTLTESAISTTSGIITTMRKYIDQAAQGSLEASDRAAILENLSNYQKEIYSTGNADSDGRSIFTGYRTNMPLTFNEDNQCKYEITEQKTNSCLDTVTYVRTGDLATINEGNYSTKTTTEYDVGSYQVARIRTAYANLDYDDAAINGTANAKFDIGFSVNTKKTAMNIGGIDKQGVTINTTSYSVFAMTDASAAGEMAVYIDGTKYPEVELTANPPVVLPSGNEGDAGTTTIKIEDGKLVIEEYSSLEKDENGDPLKYKTTSLGFEVDTETNKVTYDSKYETSLQVTDYKSTNIDSTTYEGAYMSAYGEENADKIVYVAETGEILLGSNIQSQLAGLSLDSEIKFTYEKTNWNKGDLDPVHYFYTKKYDDADPSLTNYEAADTYIEYNAERLVDKEADKAKQVIEYDIGSNQTIRVNTVAEDIYTHDIGRDVNEVITMLEEYTALLDTQSKIKEMKESGNYEDEFLEQIERQEAALSKACALAKDKVQKTCEGMLTSFDGYLKQATLAYTDVGARDSRLDLIENRLSKQKTNYEELVSENEDADVTELAIQLSSVQLTYEAALSSISYVMKTSLLNFI